MRIPIVAIVGRPNVGKSTLFNRLLHQRTAIVEDRPGVTRDRRYGSTVLITRRVTLVDTGGFDPEAQEGLEAEILNQTRIAVEEADLVVVLMDAMEGLTEADRQVVQTLRHSGRPTLHVANKVDGPTQALAAAELHALGVPQLLHVSAVHNLGVDELLRTVESMLPPAGPEAEPRAEGEDSGPIKIALVGRPNVGKSSLLNHLAGATRSIVSDQPGTTRDPVDIELNTRAGNFVVVDTAGVRRKRAVSAGMERYAVIRALRGVTEADVTVLLLDPEEGVVEQDAKLASLALETGKGLVLAFSKRDILPEPFPKEKRRLADDARDQLRFVDHAPLLFFSSLTGKGVNGLLPAVKRVYRQSGRRVPTAELNRFLLDAVDSHPPPPHQGRLVRLYYMTQPETAPPVFIISVSTKKGLTESYRKYLLNRLRQTYGFEGVPLKIWLRRRGKHDEQGGKKGRGSKGQRKPR